MDINSASVSVALAIDRVANSHKDREITKVSVSCGKEFYPVTVLTINYQTGLKTFNFLVNPETREVKNENI